MTENTATPDQPALGEHDAFTEHDPVTQMDAHSSLSDDDHGHAEMALGPIDWRAWGLALIGAASGVLVLACFWLALS